MHQLVGNCHPQAGNPSVLRYARSSSSTGRTSPPPHAHLILPHELEALGPHRPVEHWHRPLGFESDNEAALSRDLEVGRIGAVSGVLRNGWYTNGKST